MDRKVYVSNTKQTNRVLNPPYYESLFEYFPSEWNKFLLRPPSNTSSVPQPKLTEITGKRPFTSCEPAHVSFAAKPEGLGAGPHAAGAARLWSAARTERCMLGGKWPAATCQMLQKFLMKATWPLASEALEVLLSFLQKVRPEPKLWAGRGSTWTHGGRKLTGANRRQQAKLWTHNQFRL